jgi:alpha-D-ribose 1-methylphosphonate 5-triphosphate diphosphatase PhnM
MFRVENERPEYLRNAEKLPLHYKASHPNTVDFMKVTTFQNTKKVSSRESYITIGINLHNKMAVSTGSKDDEHKRHTKSSHTQHFKISEFVCTI